MKRLLACLIVCSSTSLTFPRAVAEEKAPLALQAATKALREGDPEKARKLLLDARVRDPQAAGIDFGLGLVAFTQGRLDEAATELKKSIAAKDAVGDSENLLGIVLIQQGKPEEAVVHFGNSVAANPKNADFLVNLAEAQRANGEPKKAYTLLQGAMELNPERKSYYELKLRLARIDAGDMFEVERDTVGKLQSKEIAMDWVITAAAISLRRARMDQAVALLTQAQKAMPPELFRNIMEDRAFRFYSSEPPIAAFYKVENASAKK